MCDFPGKSFSLDGDSKLLGYLKSGPQHFSYLSNKSLNIIANLTEDELLKQSPQLIQLWPEIIKDALRFLKRHDTGEWPQDQPEQDLSSFFEEKSLGVDQLEKIIKAYAGFEDLLYGASTSYRDHIAHPFRVWLIGHCLIQECIEWKFEAPTEGNLSISNVEWECMWALVALCHDLGYPARDINKVNHKVRDTFKALGLSQSGDTRFNYSRQMLPFHDTLIKLIASTPVSSKNNANEFQTHLQAKYYLKMLKSFDQLDHGIISALLIGYTLVYFLESEISLDNYKSLNAEDARQFLIRREILRAIASHTCLDIYHLHFNTLSFLLYIADELQEWGRPNLEEIKGNRNKSVLISTVVNSYTSDDVEVSLLFQDGWGPDLEEYAKDKIGKLRRVFRLAKDTVKLKDRKFSFKIGNDEKKMSFNLEMGSIKFKDSFEECDDR